jgi:hypothetical protein
MAGALAARARPLALAHGLSSMAAERDAGVAVLDVGHPEDVWTVMELLDGRRGLPARTDVAVGVVVAGDPDAASRVAEIVGDHRRRAGDAVVAVVGTPAQRRRAERVLLSHPDVEMSVVLHLDSLEGRDRDRLVRAVVRGLGLRSVAGARRHPALRPAVASTLQRRAARRAAGVAAVTGGSRATMPILTVMQARLAADLHGLRRGRPDGRSVAQVAAVGVAAPLWRQGARAIVRRAPGSAPGVRAAYAYTVTRLVGAGAQRVSSP